MSKGRLNQEEEEIIIPPYGDQRIDDANGKLIHVKETLKSWRGRLIQPSLRSEVMQMPWRVSEERTRRPLAMKDSMRFIKRLRQRKRSTRRLTFDGLLFKPRRTVRSSITLLKRQNKSAKRSLTGKTLSSRRSKSSSSRKMKSTRTLWSVNQTT